jgi:hypothetical protein
MRNKRNYLVLRNFFWDDKVFICLEFPMEIRGNMIMRITMNSMDLHEWTFPTFFSLNSRSPVIIDFHLTKRLGIEFIHSTALLTFVLEMRRIIERINVMSGKRKIERFCNLFDFTQKTAFVTWTAMSLFSKDFNYHFCVELVWS